MGAGTNKRKVLSVEGKLKGYEKSKMGKGGGKTANFCREFGVGNLTFQQPICSNTVRIVCAFDGTY